MKRRLLLLATYCLVVLAATARTGHFFPADRFSSSLIASICQDKQGAIWIGTDYGLNRFDGYRFHTFLHSEADTTSLQANVIVTLFTDSKGTLWVGTNKGLDRYNADTETFTHYPFPGNIRPRVASIMERHDGTMLIGTAGYGAFIIRADNCLTQFSKADDDQFFSYIYEDSHQRLWRGGLNDLITMRNGDKIQSFHSDMGMPQGFFELDGCVLVVCLHGILAFCNGQFAPADIDMSAVAGKDVVFSKPVVSPQGTIYIGTRGKGVYRISPTQPRRIERVTIDAFGIDMNTAKVTTACFDHDGNLWLGCHQKGILMVPQKPLQFSTWSFETQGIRLGSTVSSLCEGDDGLIWCTVQGVGVYGFNAQGHVVAHPAAPDAVEFIFRDKLRRYWLGTDDGLFAYDPLTGHSELRVTVECDKFNDMTSDTQGNIYISTFARGFCVYNPQTGELRKHSFDDTDTLNGRLCNNWIMGMSVDRKGRIWMATSSGIACYEPKTSSFRSQGWESQLSGTMCFDVCELSLGKLSDGRDLNGCIAIGTESGLYLYDPNKRSLEPFPDSQLLQDKAISYIVQANNGDIWCSTSMGIWQYSVADHTFIGHILGNGLTQKEYIYGVGMHTDDNRIFFGHNDGFTVFTPQNLEQKRTEPRPLQLVVFRVGDQTVTAGTEINGVCITDRAVSESSHFTLSYLDHTVTLAFSQFDFDNPMNIILEYRVNGGQWISNPEGQNDFILGHLQPGKYRIEVRALQGGEYSPVKVITVTVRAPWYRSTIAYILYFLLFAALAAYMFYTMRRRANRQLNEEKMKFLINATHDIRSPLTLILSALKKIEKTPAADTIERNTQRILNLVNQILDVRKIDKQQMQLHCQQTDMVAFVKGICKMYEFNATEHNITFTYSHEGLDRLEAWIDRNQFDKVISNLLSNAFKYNTDQGQILVTLAATDPAGKPLGTNTSGKPLGTAATVAEASAEAPRPSKGRGQGWGAASPSAGTLVLTVTDTGIGLDSDNIKHIFDRFYQGRNSRELHVNGTGIGLNLCKMIVDMHHGTIEAANRADGTHGSVFTVTLPLGTAHLKAEEIETTAPAGKPLGTNAAEETAAKTTTAAKPTGGTTNPTGGATVNPTGGTTANPTGGTTAEPTGGAAANLSGEAAAAPLPSEGRGQGWGTTATVAEASAEAPAALAGKPLGTNAPEEAAANTPAADNTAAAPLPSEESSQGWSTTADAPVAEASAEAPASPASSPSRPASRPTSSRHHRLLIVDDDIELGQFIADELNRYYRCHICLNGKEALRELLVGGDYDAVVSDVMMPEMDGFTMLRMIKTNLNIAHIPVIMLTSMADVGNRLEGLERGADAFLAKPFDMEELHLTIDNLIQSRQRLKGKFTGAQQQADKLEQPEVKGNDEQLMERIMKAVNKNLADSDFNVEMLTHEVGISRAQLHRKMKEMTGLSTSEFIRNIRLEQAARLLKEQKINVTQVAYTVGFSNLAHFSTIFRKHFGVAPSEYAGLPAPADSDD